MPVKRLITPSVSGDNPWAELTTAKKSCQIEEKNYEMSQNSIVSNIEIDCYHHKEGSKKSERESEICKKNFYKKVFLAD